jgi:hypothetical protein
MFQRVEVVWHDAFAITDTWMDTEDIDDLPCEVTSIGYLIPDKKPNHVVLAQSHNTHESVDSVLAIPVRMVQNIKVLD